MENLKSVSNKLKNILGKISCSRLLFSVIFSLALFFMSKIVFLGYVGQENYIDKIFLNEFSILLILVPIIYVLLYLLEKHYINISDNITTEKEFKKKNLFCLVAFMFLLIIYLTYFLTFFPGGVYIDTWTSLNMLLGEEEFTNQQPVLYTLLLLIVKAFSPNLVKGFAIFTFLQIVFMLLTFTYFIYWLLNKKVNSAIVTFITLFLGIFKLYPLYSISIWKDTLFSLVLFLLTLTIIDLIIDFKNKNIKISNIIKFCVFSALTIFFRNNGIFIVVFSLIILVLTYIKQILKEKNIVHFKSFIISICSVLLVITLIQNLYPLFGIDTSSAIVESIGIPLQQVTRIVAVDGNITEEQKEFINKIIPAEKAKKDYRALLVDPIKWNSEFDKEFLDNNIGQFFKIWFELFLQNPGEYINAYLLQTSGFWTFNVKGTEAYVSPEVWETIRNEIHNTDIIHQLSEEKISFKDDLNTYTYYSGGLFLWITLVSMFITFRTCKKKYLIGYLPAILLWLTVMIATPMAQALRYVYILVLILPLNFVYPAIAKKLDENSID